MEYALKWDGCGDGSFLAASARRNVSVGSALMAEAEALREGEKLVPQGLMHHVVAETDSQELVALWLSRRNDRSQIATILKEMEDASADFVAFTVVHVRWTANRAAHV